MGKSIYTVSAEENRNFIEKLNQNLSPEIKWIRNWDHFKRELSSNEIRVNFRFHTDNLKISQSTYRAYNLNTILIAIKYLLLVAALFLIFYSKVYWALLLFLIYVANSFMMLALKWNRVIGLIITFILISIIRGVLEIPWYISGCFYISAFLRFFIALNHDRRLLILAKEHPNHFLDLFDRGIIIDLFDESSKVTYSYTDRNLKNILNKGKITKADAPTAEEKVEAFKKKKKNPIDFPNVLNELEATDVVFRSFPKARQKFPYTGIADDGRINAIWDKLCLGQINDREAITEFRKDMERYYDMKYPLSSQQPSTQKSTNKTRVSSGHFALKSGLAFESKNQFEAALSCYDEAINSGVKEAYALRAFCLQRLFFDLDAIADFDKAIKISPEDCNLYFGRHESRYEVGNYEGAIDDLKKAIELSRTAQNQADYGSSITQTYEVALFSKQTMGPNDPEDLNLERRPI